MYNTEETLRSIVMNRSVSSKLLVRIEGKLYYFNSIMDFNEDDYLHCIEKIESHFGIANKSLGSLQGEDLKSSIIIIDCECNTDVKFMTLLHELGHMLLHIENDRHENCTYDQIELEAELFACYMTAQMGYDVEAISRVLMGKWANGDVDINVAISYVLGIIEEAKNILDIGG